jgi:DNA-binding transcriptional MerR regulator
MSSRPDNYSSYDEDEIILEIRRYRVEGYSDKKIMEFLNDIPRSTFYDYVKRMYARTAEQAKEMREHDREIMREQVEIYRERANNLILKLNKIADTSEDERVRVEALKAADTVAANIVHIQYEKPQILGELVENIDHRFTEMDRRKEHTKQ